jgi:hypothetical protein
LDGAYNEFLRRAQKSMSADFVQKGSSPEVVAKVIFKAAIDTGKRLRYPVGMDAHSLLFARWLLPDSLLFRMVKNFVLD